MPKLVYQCEHCDRTFDDYAACAAHENVCGGVDNTDALDDLRNAACDNPYFQFDRYVAMMRLSDDVLHALLQDLPTESIPALRGCATCAKTDGKIWDAECFRAGDYPCIGCSRWVLDTHYDWEPTYGDWNFPVPSIAHRLGV